jgi:hypothetical protein
VVQEYYDRLVSEGREEWLSLSDAAELLEVLDRRPDGPTTEAGYRREVRALVKAGSLRSRGAGLTVEAAECYVPLAAMHLARDFFAEIEGADNFQWTQPRWKFTLDTRLQEVIWTPKA